MCWTISSFRAAGGVELPDFNSTEQSGSCSGGPGGLLDRKSSAGGESRVGLGGLWPPGVCKKEVFCAALASDAFKSASGLPEARIAAALLVHGAACACGNAPRKAGHGCGP